MTAMRIDCPTGLVIQARPWTLGDQQFLTDEATINQGLLPLKMARCAFQKVLEPGPYHAEPSSDKLDFNEVTVADISVINNLVRRETRATLDFDRPCPYCGKLQPVCVDLREIEIGPASKDGIEHVRNGTPLVVEYQGIKVSLKLMRGMDLPELTKWQEKDVRAMLEIQACMSVDSIMAPGREKPVTGVASIRTFWRKQSWDFGEAVQDAIDQAEGVLDNMYEYKCKNCRREHLGVLPLDTEFYGVDSLGRRKKRRKSFLTPDSTSKE